MKLKFSILKSIVFTLLIITSPIKKSFAETTDFADVDMATAIQKSNKFKQYVEDLKSLDGSKPNTKHLSSVLDIPEPMENPNAKPRGVMVFVSLTMPNIALKQLLEQSNKLQIPLVIRGVLPQGFRGTLTRINKLLDQKNGEKVNSGFAINPEWFKTFDIESVPAFVTIKDGKCLPKSPCYSNDFDILYGNISMYDALEILKDGDVGDIPASILASYEQAL